MNETTKLLMIGILGVVFHCLVKMKSLRDTAIGGNIKFDWKKDYLLHDSIAILLSLLSVIIWYYTYGEVSAKYPFIVDFKRVSFLAFGIVGSWFIQFVTDLFTQSAKKKLQKFIDVKTNVADLVTGIKPDSSIEEVIDKGTMVTGKDVTKKPEPIPKVQP